MLPVHLPNIIGVDQFKSFLDSLEQLVNISNEIYIVLGDLNAPNFVMNNQCNFKTSTIYNFIDLISFRQFNGVKNDLNRLLDLILSNLSCEVIRKKCLILAEDNHHHALLLEVPDTIVKELRFKLNLKTKSCRFKSANFVELHIEPYKRDWTFLLDSEDVNIK